ncbi:MAG TPA: YscO family type III secretion system apparatus protein [Geminicoccaceae bacterium]|nr:YscO family type III secretion system apparatus protein [Geminicoccus sp.]HMU48796.1 YscO family type III secretion system apparatus protein [Geminicoccaceae bacterium]
MHDVIQQIVDVKERREERAQEEVRRRRLALEDAARRVEQRRQELQDYRIWRVRREVELWDEIETRVVKLRDIEDLKTDIGLLRGREQVLAEKVAEADKARNDANTALTQAVSVLDAAARARQKFEDLADWLEAEHRAYLERIEEIELEEQFSGGRGDVEERFA